MTVEWVTLKEAAEMFGRHPNTIIREIHLGRLDTKREPSVKNVPMYMISLESLVEDARRRGWMRQGAAIDPVAV